MTVSKRLNAGLKPVLGTRAPIAWLGGKSRLVKTILPMVPEHRCYCEAFAGAAWMLFRKPESPVEVINDINGDLITLYRVAQNHLDEFVRQFRFMLVSREEFQRFSAMRPETMTDIQRAVRFYYLIRTGYSAMPVNPTFGYSSTCHPRLNLTRLEEDLSTAHLRLARVTIERLHFSDVIRRYDAQHTFFYLDPPYFKCETDYGPGIFSRADFGRLAEQLAEIKGAFIVSLNDTPEVRKMFSRFEIREVETKYSAGSAKPSAAVREVLIGNCW